MNVITVKDTDFLRPNSPDNKKAISKQIKIIRELYSLFPYAVVAGGCPVNHLIGVPGRDIDIFVTSETEAEQIVQYFTCGMKPEQSQIQQFTLKNPDSKYINNWNSQCWKFFGVSQQPRNPGLFDMNVIVRRIPAETAVLHRIQLLPLLWETFPINRFACAYMDYDGLCIFQASGAHSFGTPEYVAKSFHKSLMFHLAQAQATGSSRGRTYWVAEQFRGDLREVRVGSAPPSSAVLGSLFMYTPHLLRDFFHRYYKVSSRNNILESQYDFLPVSGWGRCMTDEQLVQILTQERTISDVHKEVESEGRALRAKLSPDRAGYLSDLSWYSHHQRSSVGSRSQDWLDTWGIASAVQSSGREDTIMVESTPISWDNPFRNTNVLQRNMSLLDIERIRESMYARTPTFTINTGPVPPIPRPVPVTPPFTFATTQFGGPVPPGTWEPL